MVIKILEGDIMEDFQEILPVTKVKRNLLDIIKRMEKEETTIALTRNGEPVSVMMPLSILSDKQILKSNLTFKT